MTILFRYVAFTVFISALAFACTPADPNAELNESLEGTWNVTSILQGPEDIFPTSYQSQSYEFTQNEDIRERGDLEVVTVLTGSTTASTEEYIYAISNNGGTLSFDGNVQTIMVVDTTLILSNSTQVVTAVREK